MIAVALAVIAVFFTFAVKKLPRFSALCAFLAACGANAAILDWFQTGAGWLTTLAGFVVGPVAFLLGVSLWLMLRTGHDLHWKNKGAANRQTVISAALLPLVLTMVSWPVGDLVLRIGRGLLAATGKTGVV